MTTPTPSTALRRLAYLLVTLVVLGADQGTKGLVSRSLQLGEEIPVVEGLFRIHYVRNDGAAFGILSDRDSRGKDVLFYLMSTLAFAVLLYNAVKAPVTNTWLQVGLALVLGGAVGNLIDRVRAGSVVDFLEVYFRQWVWPTFNVADSCICIGIAVMAWELLRSPKPEAAPAVTAGAAANPGE